MYGLGNIQRRAQNMPRVIDIYFFKNVVTEPRLFLFAPVCVSVPVVVDELFIFLEMPSIFSLSLRVP